MAHADRGGSRRWDRPGPKAQHACIASESRIMATKDGWGGYAPAVLAQESLSPTVRLQTGAPGRESWSITK